MGRAFYPPTLTATCTRCRRPLTVADEQAGACSACGHPHRPVIGAPLRCVGCGYDLRGSPNICPECGTSVRNTLIEVRRQAMEKHASRQAWRLAGRYLRVGMMSILASAMFFAAVCSQFYHPDPNQRLRGEPKYLAEIFYTEVIVGALLAAAGVGCLVHYASVFRKTR